MKASIIAVAVVVESTYAFPPSITFKTAIIKNSMIQREMFDGLDPPPAEEDLKADKKTAGKALGLSVEEFNLARKIQVQMIQDVAAIWSQGGSESGWVAIVVKGNKPTGYLKIYLSDTDNALGKASPEKAVLAALKEATEIFGADHHWILAMVVAKNVTTSSSFFTIAGYGDGKSSGVFVGDGECELKYSHSCWISDIWFFGARTSTTADR